MDSTPVLAHRRTSAPWLRWFVVVGVMLAGLMTITVVGAVRMLSTGGPTREVRGDLEAVTGGVSPRIQVRVGRPVFFLARLVMAFTPVEAELRSALAGLKSAEVSIYELKSELTQPERAALMMQADKTLLGQGWERIVGVVDQDTLVAVYVPSGLETWHDFQACVIVVDQREMVAVAAAGDPQALFQLALKQAHSGAGARRNLLSMARLVD